MPRPYPPEFRARAVALVRAGKQAKQTAVELGIHPVTLSNWIRQDDIDEGRRPGVPGLTPFRRSGGSESRPVARSRGQGDWSDHVEQQEASHPGAGRP